jgi:hypothetical protein
MWAFVEAEHRGVGEAGEEGACSPARQGSEQARQHGRSFLHHALQLGRVETQGLRRHFAKSAAAP